MATRLSTGGETIDTVVQVAIEKHNRLADAERLVVTRREELERLMATLTPEQMATYVRNTA